MSECCASGSCEVCNPSAHPELARPKPPRNTPCAPERRDRPEWEELALLPRDRYRIQEFPEGWRVMGRTGENQ